MEIRRQMKPRGSPRLKLVLVVPGRAHALALVLLCIITNITIYYGILLSSSSINKPPIIFTYSQPLTCMAWTLLRGSCSLKGSRDRESGVGINILVYTRSPGNTVHRRRGGGQQRYLVVLGWQVGQASVLGNRARTGAGKNSVGGAGVWKQTGGIT